MIDFTTAEKQALLENCIHREIVLRFPDAAEGELKEIGSKNIIADSFELVQSICDEEKFVIGGCIVGQMTVQVINIEQELNNKRVNVFLKQTYISGNLYPGHILYPSDVLYPGDVVSTVEIQIFSGIIDSSLRQKNRSVKEIIAYDDLYKASNITCYNFFSSFAQYSPNAKLYDIREILVDKFISDYDYESEFVGFNDETALSLSLELVKSVCNSKMTVTDLLAAYCELNACFAYMNGEGKIKFVQLINPQSETIEFYSDLEFEEYTTTPINLIKFTYNKDKTFVYGHTEQEKQSWYISDNIITSCCTDVRELITAFNDNNGANYIFYDLYKYRPFSADIYARWWIEPGDKVVIKTGYNDTEAVESFVFSRTLSGINGMRSSVKSKGKEYLGKDEIDNE